MDPLKAAEFDEILCDGLRGATIRHEVLAFPAIDEGQRLLLGLQDLGHVDRELADVEGHPSVRDEDLFVKIERLVIVQSVTKDVLVPATKGRTDAPSEEFDETKGLWHQILVGAIELKKCVPLKAINQVVEARFEDGLHVLLGHISEQSVTAMKRLGGRHPGSHGVMKNNHLAH